MKKFILSFITILGLSQFYSFAQPIITCISPSSGKIGTVVTVSGNGFSSTLSNNTIYIGGARASAITSSSNSITLSVPIGATFNKMSVNVSNLQGFSNAIFNPTFGDNESISSSSFGSGSSFTTPSQPHVIDVADIDGDGKVDIVVNCVSGQRISIFRNTSTVGNVSFATRFDLTTPTNCNAVCLVDLDGDGKIDIVGTNRTTSNSIGIFRNTSTSGNLSFAARVDYSAGSDPYQPVFADINADGKPEIVNAAFASGQIAVHENTSSSGSISFNSAVFFTSGSGTSMLSAEDIDGDGKVDIVSSNFTSNKFVIFRNTHTSGSIASGSLTSSDLSIGTNPQHVNLNDIDGDGKKDLITTHQTAGNLVIYRNTSTSGSISFATGVSYTSGSVARSAMVADINGDGKPDVVTSNISSNTFRVYQNNSTSGSISLSTGTTFATNAGPYYAYPVDVDGDTKPDIITANFSSNNIQVFRNTQLASEPTTTSSFMSFGSLTGTSMTVSWANGNGARRLVALKASATPPSVSGPVDATEYTANSVFGSGSNLGSDWFVVYDGTGSSVNITGLTNNQQYYCVIFEYNGKDATINYSTSYASGTQLLPVEWLYVKGTHQSDGNVMLRWATAWEINNSHFEVERAARDGRFEYVDQVRGHGNTLLTSHYEYTDVTWTGTNEFAYYRLKQVDFNGATDYSPVVVVGRMSQAGVQVPKAYMDDTRGVLSIYHGHPQNEIKYLTVTDTRGVKVWQGAYTGAISYTNWAAGIYLVQITYRNALGQEQVQASKVVR
jgi:hypothetical protein